MARRRGQTIIELLVVISLIAMLIATLVPSIRRSMRLAASTVCKSNLQQIGLGLRMYRLENDGWLPSVQDAGYAPDPLPQDTVWFLKLYPNYLPDLLVLRCPEDPFGNRMLKTRTRVNDPSVGDWASYGINSFIMRGGDGFLADLDRHRPSRPLDTILVADIGPDYGSPAAGSNVSEGPSRNGSLLAVDDRYDPFEQDVSAPWLTARHGRGINMLTLAGGIREAETVEALQHPVARYYQPCAAGDCTLCVELHLYHYSFARDRLFWWTGPTPTE